MTWLVTGGAGYIGAHVVRALLDSGHAVSVFDDLSSGDRARIPPGVPLTVASLSDDAALHRALRAPAVQGVVHLAARKSVVESIADPDRYYRDNTEGTRRVVEAMLAAQVHRLILSSTAAVYGDVDTLLVAEDAVPSPLSPYGRSKLAAEWVVADAAAVTELTHLTLRYFNVIGATEPQLLDPTRTGVLPAMMDAVLAGRPPTVFGVDHATPDGSCVRDYVHVADVAQAHVSAVAALEAGTSSGEVLNVGRGEGCSVLEMLRTIEKVTERQVGCHVAVRRPGDAAHAVADVTRIGQVLGWQAAHDVEDMVRSEWHALRGRIQP